MRPIHKTTNVLIVGRGVAGVTLAADVSERGGKVVGFLDDSAQGPDILGKLSDVNTVVETHKVNVVYYAIPSSSAQVLREFISTIDLTATEIAIIPRTYDILGKERVNIDDLTDIDVLDLVGREPVKHDMIESHKYIQDKIVLVTGASGSIGSHLFTQLNVLGAKQVIGIDRSERGIFELSHKSSKFEKTIVRIGDIQNREQMDLFLSEYKPDIIFHAAAYKHVPLMQLNPLEALNNNTWGSLNLMQLAIKNSVESFIYVSTDKAVNPANVMGASKRLGEILMKNLARKSTSTRFVGVRFGNVLESDGSVMQTFRRQIADNQSLTVTHPEVTRFFMTIDEACQLIIRSACSGEQGDLFVLDMGEPIKIIDLAQGLVNAINPKLGINIIGLRPGEKMFEELSYNESDVDLTKHPKIFVVKESTHEIALNETWISELLQLTRSYSISDNELIDKLREIGFEIQ